MGQFSSREKCPFQNHFLCPAFLWTVEWGDIQGVKGGPPEYGSPVMWRTSFLVMHKMAFYTSCSWLIFLKQKTPTQNVFNNIKCITYFLKISTHSQEDFLFFSRTIFLPELLHFYSCCSNALLLQRWVTQPDTVLIPVWQFLHSALYRQSSTCVFFLPTERTTLMSSAPFLHYSAAALSKDVLIFYAGFRKKKIWGNYGNCGSLKRISNYQKRPLWCA